MANRIVIHLDDKTVDTQYALAQEIAQFCRQRGTIVYKAEVVKVYPEQFVEIPEAK